MEVLTAIELKLRRREIIDRILKGAVFIHPTDTIYGLGCLATNSAAVEKIRKIKERAANPFSIWVPDREWISRNCVANKKVDEWMEKLPGAYTLVLKLKDKKAIASAVTLGLNTVGVRFPDHWFSAVVQELNVPIVTTSANKSGQPFMTSIEDLDPDIEKDVEFIIYEGPKKGRPSKIVNLVEGTEKER
ncbi:threonylcarbamoyl-AMP synthase [Candidatus Woesearchaeota archaeon]|nr:threonylcarbamoyl-AMP synthase [Candidatus Woesearchaeota archaeon]